MNSTVKSILLVIISVSAASLTTANFSFANEQETPQVAESTEGGDREPASARVPAQGRKSPPKKSPKQELLDSTPDPETIQVKGEPQWDPSDRLPIAYWQAPHGRFTATPFLRASYFKNDGTYITGNTFGASYRISGQAYAGGGELEYGLLKYLSVNVGASYLAQYTDEDVTTITGIQDIQIQGKGYYPLPSMNLHYGLKIAVSPSDQVGDGQGNSNSFSGGNTYTPYAGLSKRLEKGHVGVYLSYAYKGPRTIGRDANGNVQNARSTLEGGHVFTGTGFYERRVSSWGFGGDVGFITEAGKTFRNPLQVNPTYSSGENNFVGGLYAYFKQADNMLIVPRFEGQTFLNDQLGDRRVDAKWIISLKADVHFTF